MKTKVLFLTLRVFSATGGIEKVCRIVGKALYELGLQYGGMVNIFSLYGPSQKADDNKYFSQLLFRGFENKRIKFILQSIRVGHHSKIVLLSHINLLVVGYLIKLMRPSVKLVLLAHGIEVWEPLPAWKKKMLHKCDLILPVSHFTKNKMRSLYGLPEEKLRVLNNCLDPFLEMPLEKEKNPLLQAKYGIKKDQKILLTVSRMVATEQYKGYDKVLQILPGLIKTYPSLCYIMVGKYDVLEKQRLDNLVNSLGVKDHVIFGGFIEEEEMASHFKLADIFVMPSEKEGFGIVFIEAMFYGIPVIAGNKDGSADALVNGELGLLVDPDDKNELIIAIKKILDNKEDHIPDGYKLMEHFSYRGYKEKLGSVLELRVNS